MTAIAGHWFAGAALAVMFVVGYVWLWRLAPRMQGPDTGTQAEERAEQGPGRRNVPGDSGTA